MRGRRTEGSDGGGRGFRDLSPTTAPGKIREHRADWHQRVHFQQHRPRRSLSPPARDRSRRSSPPGHRRSTSVERREYASSSRNLDHGKQLHPEFLPSSGPRGRPLPFDRESYDLPLKYMMPDHSSGLNIPEVNASSKPSSRLIKEQDFLHPDNGVPVSYSGLEMHSTLPRKSLFLEGGAAREFYSQTLDVSYSFDAAALKSDSMGGSSSSTMNAGIRDYQNLNHLMDPYDSRERGNIYSKDVSIAAAMASSQLRPYSGPPSSTIANDDLLGLYDDYHLHQPLDEFTRISSLNKLPEDPLRMGYNQLQFSEPVRRVRLSPSDLNETQDYGYHELSQKGRANHTFCETDDVYRPVAWDSRGDYEDKISSSFTDVTRCRIDDGLNASQKLPYEGRTWDHQRSLHRDIAPEYPELKGVHDNYVSGPATGHLGQSIRPSRGQGRTSFEVAYGSEREAAPMSCREGPNSPMLSTRHISMYRKPINSPRGKSDMDDLYNLSPERMVRRRYVTDSGIDEFEPRNIYRSAFGRIHSPSSNDVMGHNQERQRVLHVKKLTFGHSKYKMIPRVVPKFHARLPSGDSSKYGEHGRTMSLKRRLRPGPSEMHGSYASDGRKEYFRPKKFWKRDLEEGHGDLSVKDGDAPDGNTVFLKTDPPAESEEFKKQIHKAFLCFSKMINESPQAQKKYQEQRQGSSLTCCVCGSSKEFSETHRLVQHAYQSPRVGLKTKHLGFHKALCVLMGWNSLVPPDVEKNYQSLSIAEAKALKEDLILWPPVVVIHNNSISNICNNKKVVTTEGMEEILKEMGFEAGKQKVCRGRPASSSVLLVKFSATFSGLQEAERLHKHFADNDRGRQAFEEMASNKSSTEGERESRSSNVEELVYGYMAIAEDLHKLDSETKKRCLVKSKKDIEAIADPPLNVD